MKDINRAKFLSDYEKKTGEPSFGFLPDWF